MANTILIALGGNAIKQAYERGTSEEQFKNCKKTTAFLANIVQNLALEDRLLITHGNGPQVGNLMVQQKAAENIVPAHPMNVIVAMTQGQIGYMLQQTLINHLKEKNINRSVCVLLNRVLVDHNDLEFQDENASKPIGNFLTREEAEELKRNNPDYIVKKVKPGSQYCWRRVVPSPDPISNLDSDVINKLINLGIIVITSGGGGIPVVEDRDRQLKGIEAVIDKDLAAERLAEIIHANILFILTDVEKAKINFGQPDEKELGNITFDEAKKYYKEGHFLPGSMGPKIKACLRFLENGGEKAIISSLDKVIESYNGITGTIIVK